MLSLLHDVRQLVREQAAARARSGCVVAGGEDDCFAERVGARAVRRRAGRARLRVQTNAAEVLSEERLEV